MTIKLNYSTVLLVTFHNNMSTTNRQVKAKRFYVLLNKERDRTLLHSPFKAPLYNKHDNMLVLTTIEVKFKY